MPEVDCYGLTLTGSAEAARAYRRGLDAVLSLTGGSVEAMAASITHDPTFALGHAALALLGHEFCAPVDLSARLRDAQLHARRSTARERSHVHAVVRHIGGDSRPLIAHLREHPRDALLLSTAMPTIAFGGATKVPREAWEIVEGAAPAYGDDWWCSGLLAFVRQEQLRFDDAMDLSCRSLRERPDAGHSAHARAHAHYETADHRAGLAWMDDWILGDGAGVDNLTHFSWHAALHELSMGDVAAVQRRYDTQLAPRPSGDCRVLVDTGSLLWRWQLTSGRDGVPDMHDVTAFVDRPVLTAPATPFLGLHAAVALLATDDADGLEELRRSCADHPDVDHREVTAPLAEALRLLVAGSPGAAADALAALTHRCWRFGGSDAQREIVEETRIHALIRAERYLEARALLDRRLDRRTCRRDQDWLNRCR